MTVVVKVEQLVAPLCYYSDRILDEGDDNEESSDGREVAARDSQHGKEGGGGRGSTYGLRGSLRVSRRSSILLVWALMASRGLEFAVSASLCPPKGLWAPMP